MKKVSLVLMAIVYIAAGIMHFRKPEVYMKIMPPWIPEHHLMVVLSGIAEVTLGAGLLVSPVSRYAAMGLMALLVAVFPANIYMAQQGGRAFGLAEWMVWVRLPIQGVLILWAAWHAELF
ncbi:MAG: DoxX family membrane protein [Methylotenera sp.]|nr:DoxX family membrane protein [Oligoflexia bacterium]